MQNQSKTLSKTGEPQWTILKLLKWTTSYFNSHDIDNPRAAAEILLAHILKVNRIDLYLRYDQPLYSSELSNFKVLIKRRINREPIAYIVGSKEFWGMELFITKDVLIPRPETECLVETILSFLPEKTDGTPKRVLELGTGSGAVILALAAQRTKHLFFASDRIVKAVELAQKNARHHGLDGSINFFSGDWFAPFDNDINPFDIIVSNPPYIPTQVIGRLQPEIFMYEPVMALDGGEDGLQSINHIIRFAHLYLSKTGYMFLEIGHDQKSGVEKIIDSCNQFKEVVFKKDYSGYYRIVQMRKKEICNENTKD